MGSKRLLDPQKIFNHQHHNYNSSDVILYHQVTVMIIDITTPVMMVNRHVSLFALLSSVFVVGVPDYILHMTTEL